MEYRLLGRSGLKVSTITMGTMTFGNRHKIGDTDVKGAQRQIDLCLDAGVNLFDTANAYTRGVSEEMIGEVMDKKRWKKALIATKVRFPMGDGPNDNGLSRWHIIQQCEGSLKRLKTDVIDLYQVHQWDGSTPLEETMEALDTLVKQGKIRYVGCSNYSGWHIMKALGVSEKHNYQRFVSQQIHYTLHCRDAEYELVPISLDQGLGILVWSPIAGGLLSGKFRRNRPVPDGARHTGGHAEPPVYDWEKLYDIIEAIMGVADSHGVSGAQVALAWLLQRPGVTSVVIGGRTEEQFKDNLAAADLKLTAEEIKTLDTVSQPTLLYPYWHQNWAVYDRMTPADLALHAGYPRKGCNDCKLEGGALDIRRRPETTMRLTRQSSYAIRTLIYCAVNDPDLSRVADIAKAHAISELFLFKLIKPLVENGLLRTVRGRHGGIRLGRPAAEITLLDTIQLTEENFAMAECFEDGDVSCPLSDACDLNAALREALGAFFGVLESHTIADLANKRKHLRERLGLKDLARISAALN